MKPMKGPCTSKKKAMSSKKKGQAKNSSYANKK